MVNKVFQNWLLIMSYHVGVGWSPKVWGASAPPLSLSGSHSTVNMSLTIGGFFAEFGASRSNGVTVSRVPRKIESHGAPSPWVKEHGWSSPQTSPS